MSEKINKDTNKFLIGIIRAFLNHLEWNGEEDLKAGAIKNTGYIKLTTDGPNFIIEDVVGGRKIIKY